MKTAVVIPARNEYRTIGALVAAALQYVDGVYVVDDQSDDETAAIARRAGASVLHTDPNRRGLSDVYRFGLLIAGAGQYSVIIEMDAGGSHDPNDLPLFLDKMRDHDPFDMVCGKRFAGGHYHGHFKRKALSWGGTQLYNLRHGTRWADATSGYIAYRRELLELTHGLPFRAAGHYYQSEVRARATAAGARICEVPITYRNSASHLNQASIFEALRQLIAPAP